MRGTDLDEIRQTGRDLRALLQTARTAEARADLEMRAARAAGHLAKRDYLSRYEGIVRSIVRAAGVRVFAARADSRLKLRIECPSGEVVEHAVDAEYRPTAQASRVWFALQLEAGVDPEMVAERFNRLQAKAGAYLEHTPAAPKPVTVGHVRAAAAYHRMCEHVPPPPGTLRRSVHEIAALTGLPADAILGAAIRGRLGTAAICSNGQFSVDADDALLEAALPDFGRKVVAERERWCVSDTKTISEIGGLLGGDFNVGRRGLRYWGKVVRDRSGRPWARASGAVPSVTEALRRKLASDPVLSATRLEWWVLMQRAREQLPHTNERTIQRQARVVRLRDSGPQHSSVFVYLDPATRRRLSRPLLEDAVAELATETNLAFVAEDFLPRGEARMESRHYGLIDLKMWRRAARAGELIELQARARKRGRLEYWTYFPVQLRGGSDPAGFAAWRADSFRPGDLSSTTAVTTGSILESSAPLHAPTHADPWTDCLINRVSRTVKEPTVNASREGRPPPNARESRRECGGRRDHLQLRYSPAAAIVASPA